ncbi:MAG TPA: sulfite reductase subunit alpha [Bacteroidia bacterium]|nr:sulfite reductase subunit alpha [Bacteroidia bacterium]
MSTLPTIPDSAPFTPAQRLWLNGYLAGRLSAASSQPAIASRPRLRVPVVYASQTGNAASLAEDFAKRLAEAGFDAPCCGADELGDIDLAKEKLLILVSSTWGDGDPPDHAAEFWSALQSDDHPRLEQLRYAVLALGDSNYLRFCAQGKAFDARLEALGAVRLAPRADCDTDYEEAAAAWFETVLTELQKESPSDATPKAPVAPETDRATAAIGYSKKNPFPAKLLANVRLNAPESARDTRHFEIDLAGSGLAYEAGDALGVWPRNDPACIDELLAALGLSPDETAPLPDGASAPLREALIARYDVTGLGRKLLAEWSARSGSSFLHELLASDDPAAIESFLHGRELIDLVLHHPVRFESAADFVAMLRPLAPRLYSISSSPKAHPGQVHLTVARVAYTSHGRERHGVCSTFLADRVGDGGILPVFLQPSAHFRLPADPGKDIILCGPGTGIAPFRAFLEEREVTGAKGRNWLLFGNPHEAADFLYRDEILAMRERGLLTRLDLAWSRDGAAKVYVQDKMREAGEELWRWLDGGAHFYVCGDAKRMAKDVDRALHEIAATHGGLGEEGAAEFVKRLAKERRYLRDVY